MSPLEGLQVAVTRAAPVALGAATAAAVPGEAVAAMQPQPDTSEVVSAQFLKI